MSKLGRAYETLKDDSSRRAYDLIYPSLTSRHPFAQSTPTSYTHTASSTQQAEAHEAAQIAALQKSKQERDARWRIKKSAFDWSIANLQRGIRELEGKIKILDVTIAAEAAKEAQKNSWTTWFLSPITKKIEETEEDKERKDRERQERAIEKDMKERRLSSKKADLKKEDTALKTAKAELDAANRCDEGKIQVIQARIQARETRQRQEREKVERERIAKIWKQQQEQREKREREAAEALRKQLAEEQAARQKQQAEESRRLQEILRNETRRYKEEYTHYSPYERSTHRTQTSACSHDGWWSKVHGRTACPKCHEVWTYLLECPGCSMKACPKCQADIRPRNRGYRGRTNYRAPPRMRTPSPDYHDEYLWYD